MSGAAAIGGVASSQQWLSASIGDIATVDWGNTSLTKKAYSPEGGFLGVSAAGCDGRMEFAEHKALTPVLSAIGANCGRMFLPTEDFTAIKNTITLTPKEGICDSVFLYYLLDSVDLPKRGAGQPFISKGDIQKFPISIPSLNEQKRIVAVLDQAFAALDRARAHAEANLADAHEFLESFVEQQLEESGGEVVSLQELLDTGAITGHLDGNHGSDYPRKEDFVETGVPYISANCMIDQEIDIEQAKFLSEERALRMRKGVAQDRDVLFAHNATVGPVALLRTNLSKIILSTSLTYYRCNSDKVLPEFLVYEMRGANFRRQYESVMRQATRNQVPITAQRKFVHVIPSITEQRRIMESCAEIEVLSRRLVERYADEIRDLANLRQSLLQKACSGELT